MLLWTIPFALSHWSAQAPISQHPVPGAALLTYWGHFCSKGSRLRNRSLDKEEALETSTQTNKTPALGKLAEFGARNFKTVHDPLLIRILTHEQKIILEEEKT